MCDWWSAVQCAVPAGLCAVLSHWYQQFKCVELDRRCSLKKTFIPRHKHAWVHFSFIVLIINLLFWSLVTECKLEQTWREGCGGKKGCKGRAEDWSCYTVGGEKRKCGKMSRVKNLGHKGGGKGELWMWGKKMERMWREQEITREATTKDKNSLKGDIKIIMV